MIAPGFLARRIERLPAAVPLPPVEVSPPSAIAFSRAKVISTFDVEPDALTFLTKDFGSSAGLATNGFGGNGLGTLTVAGGSAQIVNTGTAIMHTDVRAGDDLTMPQVFVSVDVTARSSSGSFIYDHCRLGVSKGPADWFGVIWDKQANRFLLEQCVGGTITQWNGDTVTLNPPLRLGMSLVGNGIAVWTSNDSGATWALRGRQILTAEPRTTSMTGLRPFFGSAKSGSGTGSWTFDNLQAGRFGAVKMRDPSWVTEENGNLRSFAGKPRATVTCVDPNGIGYLGVIELDTATETIRQVGVLMEDRDGGIWNDLSGHLCRLSDDTWQLLNATWGNNPFGGGALNIMREVTAANISEGSHVVASTTISPPNVPSPNGGAYDPTCVRFGGEWWVAYTVVNPQTFVGENFYPALAKTTDWVSWTAISADETEPQNEGTKVLVSGGSLYVVTGGRGEQIVYDSGLTEIASALNVNVALYSGSDTQPWPAIGAWGDEWLMLTFDNATSGGVAFTWGDLWLYRAPRYV